MHWWDSGTHMGWMGAWWFLGAVLLLATFWALLRMTRGPRKDDGESPEHVLKRRYAQGELDRETYLRMLTDLKA